MENLDTNVIIKVVAVLTKLNQAFTITLSMNVVSCQNFIVNSANDSLNNQCHIRRTC